MSVDKAQLYGKFQQHEDAKQKLALKVAHKSLDVADDDMHIQANRTVNQTGMPYGLALASILAAATIPAVGVWLASNRGVATPAPTQPAATMPAVADSEYEVRFYDKDGNPIVVPHISTIKGKK